MEEIGVYRLDSLFSETFLLVLSQNHFHCLFLQPSGLKCCYYLTILSFHRLPAWTWSGNNPSRALDTRIPQEYDDFSLFFTSGCSLRKNHELPLDKPII